MSELILGTVKETITAAASNQSSLIAVVALFVVGGLLAWAMYLLATKRR
jgi:hypothetical protein